MDKTSTGIPKIFLHEMVEDINQKIDHHGRAIARADQISYANVKVLVEFFNVHVEDGVLVFTKI